jgi:manganese/zinc/iron transport system substrate-binding protein
MFRRFFMILTAVALLSSCGGKKDAPATNANPVAPKRPKMVMATTTMVADMVRRVAGDKVEVVGLMGPGVDPHLFKANTADISNLAKAKAIFFNGMHLEGRMIEIFETMAQKGIIIVPVGEAVPLKQRLVPKDAGGHADPHVWGNVQHWILAIDPVIKALSQVEPGASATFEANGAALKAEWTALHEWALKRVSLIPKERRLLVTSHDAFAYFGEAYGFEVIGIQGISTVSEAGLADITRTVDLVKERKIPAIFVESSVSHATIDRVAADAGIRIGGELFSDAYGQPGKMETVDGETYDVGTYSGMIKHNINSVVEALK